MAYSDETDKGLIVPRKWYERLPREAWSAYERVEQPDEWFQVYRLTGDVYAIYEDGQFEEVISYLVLGEEAAALIDTGNGIGDIKALVEGLTSLPVTVVNTHTHGDHVGGNHQFERVQVFDHDYSRERARRGRSREEMGNYLEGEMVWKPFPPYFNPQEWSIKPFKVSRWLRDGDKVELGGRTLEVYHVPGHSPDSVCILDRGEGVLWSGDSFYPAPIYVYGEGTSLEEFVASFKRMVDLAPHYDWVMPSHNEPKVEKHLIEKCYHAAKDILEGREGDYVEGVANGVRVRRYDLGEFSLIVRAEP